MQTIIEMIKQGKEHLKNQGCAADIVSMSYPTYIIFAKEMEYTGHTCISRIEGLRLCIDNRIPEHTIYLSHSTSYYNP
jgi:hypothetical protein